MTMAEKKFKQNVELDFSALKSFQGLYKLDFRCLHKKIYTPRPVCDGINLEAYPFGEYEEY